MFTCTSEFLIDHRDFYGFAFKNCFFADFSSFFALVHVYRFYFSSNKTRTQNLWNIFCESTFHHDRKRKILLSFFLEQPLMEEAGLGNSGKHAGLQEMRGKVLLKDVP